MVRPQQRSLKSRIDTQHNRYALRSRKHRLIKELLDISPTANYQNHVRRRHIKRSQLKKFTNPANANFVPKTYDTGFVRFGQFGATKETIESTIEWYKKQVGIRKNARATITAKRKQRNRNLSSKRLQLKRPLQGECKGVAKKNVVSRCRLTKSIAKKCLQNAAGVLQPRVTKTSHDNANSQCNDVPLIPTKESGENINRSANYELNNLHSLPICLRRPQESQTKLIENQSPAQSIVETESNTSNGTITSLQQKFSNFANAMNRFIAKFLEFWNEYFHDSEVNEVAPFASNVYRYSVPSWMCDGNISFHNGDYCSGNNAEDTSDQASYEQDSQIYQNDAAAVAGPNRSTVLMPLQQKVSVGTSTSMSEVDGIAEVLANDPKDEHGVDT